MKKRIAYLSVLAVVLAATYFGFGSPSMQPVIALPIQGEIDSRDFVMWRKHLGVVPGQMLRITGGMEDGSGRGQQTFQCQVFDQDGDLVFQTAPRLVPPRGFLQENVTFADLTLVAGDSATGRKQVMVEVRVQRSRNAKSSNFIGALELVDSDGKTAAHKTLLTQFAINGNSP